MKKSKIWIHVCVHLLLFITLGVHSRISNINPVTDDINRLSVLRQNIPKDYKIPLRYIPKEEGGMCWIQLNVFYLEESLQNMSDKFGNISSNRKDISIIIHILRELRVTINSRSLENIMLDFECHYREERWQTGRYFDFVKDFLIAEQNKDYSDDCDPPPCPTTADTVRTDGSTAAATVTPTPAPTCQTDCSPQPFLSPLVERSLLSLLFIPLLVMIFLLVWKVRSRRNPENLPENPGQNGLLSTEGTAPPLDAKKSETIHLNVIETLTV